MTIQYLPLKDLSIARENTRKSRQADEIQTLAESIKAVGILHTLVGYQDKNKTHITDGGTRLKALRLLAKQEGDFGELLGKIPVHICGKEKAIDVSLSANLVRSAMSAADQFTAFHKLHHIEGVSIDDIAKRYFVDTATVKRILKLASLAKPIFKAFKDGEITLDVAKAYAGCSDIDRQLTAFETCGVKANTYAVRSALRENTYLADSARVKFVGLQTYRDKGGAVEDDLFDEKTICLNGDIIDDLMSEAIAAHTKSLEGEGWSNVLYFEDRQAFYDASNSFGNRIFPSCNPTKKQQKEMQSLSDKMESMGYYWGLEHDEREAYDRLQETYETLEQAASNFTKEEIETGVMLWYFDEDGPNHSAYAATKEEIKTAQKEKVVRDYPENFERHVLATAGDALMEHLTRNPNVVTTALAIAALEFSYFPALKVSISSRPKLKFNRSADSSRDIEETVTNPWDMRPTDMIARVKELAQMSDGERQSVLAGLLREGFSMGEGATDLKDQMALFHYLGDESGFAITDYWTFAETELKSLTKAQLLRVLKTMGLNPSSFSKAKKSELVTVTARYAAEQKWTPEFLHEILNAGESEDVDSENKIAA